MINYLLRAFLPCAGPHDVLLWCCPVPPSARGAQEYGTKDERQLHRLDSTRLEWVVRCNRRRSRIRRRSDVVLVIQLVFMVVVVAIIVVHIQAKAARDIPPPVFMRNWSSNLRMECAGSR